MKIQLPTWIESAQAKPLTNIFPLGEIFIIGVKDRKRSLTKLFESLFEWQIKAIEEQVDRGVFEFQTPRGRLWCVRLSEKLESSGVAPEPSVLALHKARAGEVLRSVEAAQVKVANFYFLGCSDTEVAAFALGLELAQYRFNPKPDRLPQLSLQVLNAKESKAVSAEIIAEAALLACGVNTARHLVNLPPNELQPVSFANLLKELFGKSKNI